MLCFSNSINPFHFVQVLQAGSVLFTSGNAPAKKRAKLTERWCWLWGPSSTYSSVWMGCASQRAGGCQTGPGSERIQMFYINFLSGVCPQLKWTGTIKEKTHHWMVDPGTEHYLGSQLCNVSSCGKLHRLSVFWHLKQRPLPFFPLANPTGLHLGGKRQALPWLAPRSCAGACARQLIILFIIVAPQFALLFESIVGMTRENYVWVGKEVNAGLKIDP